MNNASKPLSILVALGAALAMPIAFAQTAPTPTAQDDAMQSATPQSAQPQPEAAPQAQPKQVTWADLDSDKDGNLSKSETATVPELSKIFDQADANKDGKLSAEEYKSFAMQQQGSTPGGGGH